MAETLGKMEKPEAASFKLGRKLIYVPLIFLPPDDDDIELAALVKKFWAEAAAQVNKLSSGLDGIKKIYHELVPGGEEGLKTIDSLRSGSQEMVKSAVEAGAALQETEDMEALAEFLDWGRCLSIRLESPKVFGVVYENYLKSQQQRAEAIGKKIDETLSNDELGLAFLREGHSVQFPSDIQVFYVAPPSLDALRRYITDRLEKEPMDSQEEARAEDTESQGEEAKTSDKEP
jgi:hypothetical protein